MPETPEQTERTAVDSAVPGNGFDGDFWRRFRPGGRDRAQGAPVRHAIAPRWPARTGNTIPFVTLAPTYRGEHHQIYLDLLERALRHPDTRSVALTGSYGSGKSSVLRALDRPWWKRFWLQRRWLRRRVIIKLSLSTLDPRLAPAVQTGNPAERERSNQIQKELVKQLLFQLPPRKTPHSRFPRASRPSRLAGVRAAMSGAALVGVAWLVTHLTGWQAVIDQRLSKAGWTEKWFWGGVTVGFVFLVVVVWRTLAGKYALRAGIEAGALTVSLEPTSSSYFDQYLDEIMYFFQVSRTDVVLIEDVDRFEDAAVFDTLRALNNLINGSRQVGRRVVFVYAIRDSVLGEIGAAENEESGKQRGGLASIPGSQALEIDRANRVKYFDVIIPIVPFLTTDNARDLMTKVMKPHVADSPEANGISPALIRLAARHVADMRTLWSIRNEFEVHLDRLMTSARNATPGIDEDIVLSLVLLRATSPETYEGIRLKTSGLDDLAKRWFELVDANLEDQTTKLTSLRTQLESGASQDTRAARAGQKLDSLRSELLAPPTGFVADRVVFSGPLADADLTDLAGWHQIANGTPLEVTLHAKRPGFPPNVSQVRLHPQIVASLIDMQVDPDAWHEADLDDLHEKIKAAENEIVFLRHHTWKQLYSRTDLTVAAAPGEVPTKPSGGTQGEVKVSFKDLVARYAPTELAGDLIAHGHLPLHFARYASMFYGDVVGLNAAEYIARAIEPGAPIIEYELDDKSVHQILVEQGADRDDADLFDDLSVYNLDLVAYLLSRRPGAARRVAAHLAQRWSDLEQKFVGRFFQRESQGTAGALAALMAPTWGQALRYTAVDAQLAPDARLRLVDAVLGAIGVDEREDLDSEVGAYLSECYTNIEAVAQPADSVRASIVISTMAAAGGNLAYLAPLNSHAKAAAIEAGIYTVNAANLEALGGAEAVALDVLRPQSTTRPIYDHALVQLDLYLHALPRLEPPGTPVKDPANFATVLNDIAGTPRSPLLDRFVTSTSADCRVADLQDAAPEAWTVLINHGRTDPTFGNVQRYITEHGLDLALGQFLAGHAKITTPEAITQAERLDVATKIIAARVAIPTPEVRAKLAASIEPGFLPIGEIDREDACMVGPLLLAKLLGDVPDTFEPRLLAEWKDLEPAIAASKLFGQFASSATMPVQFLAQTLTSSVIPEAKKVELIGKVDSLLDGAKPQDATAIARVLADRPETLDVARIDALAEAGAATPDLLHLIVAQGEHLSLEDLRVLLSTMPDKYRRVSEGGQGPVRFDVDPDHRALLQRFSGVTHNGAKLKRTVRHGEQLVAYLTQPSA